MIPTGTLDFAVNVPSSRGGVSKKRGGTAIEAEFHHINFGDTIGDVEKLRKRKEKKWVWEWWNCDGDRGQTLAHHLWSLILENKTKQINNIIETICSQNCEIVDSYFRLAIHAPIAYVHAAIWWNPQQNGKHINFTQDALAIPLTEQSKPWILTVYRRFWDLCSCIYPTLTLNWKRRSPKVLVANAY